MQGNSQWVLYGLTDNGWKVIEVKYHENAMKKFCEDIFYLSYKLRDDWALFDRHRQELVEEFRSGETERLEALLSQYGSIQDYLPGIGTYTE